MTPQEKIKWFWATGVLPGTMFDDWDEKKRTPQNKSLRRQVSWLRWLSLGLLG